jgi:hypothetical protein
MRNTVSIFFAGFVLFSPNILSFPDLRALYRCADDHHLLDDVEWGFES